MNKTSYVGVHVPQASAAKAFALAALLFFWALPSQAAQSNTQFTLTINLQSPNAGLCQSGTRIGTFGATVTVVCTTGTAEKFSGNIASLPTTTADDNSYRFLTQISRSGEPLGTVDSYVGIGTVTSWRVVNLDNQDYLEMMVHW